MWAPQSAAGVVIFGVSAVGKPAKNPTNDKNPDKKTGIMIGSQGYLLEVRQGPSQKYLEEGTWRRETPRKFLEVAVVLVHF